MTDIFESSSCQICGKLRNTRLDGMIGRICLDCHDEKIKNWKSDIFCCRSMEYNYRNGHVDTSSSWPNSKLGMLIKTISFYNEQEEIKKHMQDRLIGFGRCSSIEYCPWCGFKITEEFIRKIINYHKDR